MSTIDVTKPVTGNPTTASVRDNFAQAKTDIETAQSAAEAAAATADAAQPALGFTAENVANKSTNVTTDGASDTKYPSAKAVKSYADAAGLGAKGTLFSLAYAAYDHVEAQAHGLSGVPNFFVAWAKCTSTDAEYSVNDIVPIQWDCGAYYNNMGGNISFDATNTHLSTRPNGIALQKKTTNAQTIFALNKWTFYIQPYLIS